jgi:hypothetical protein
VPPPHLIFDTQVLVMVDWPEKDLINWVKYRIRAFEVARENEKKGIGSEPPDHPLSEMELKIWLSSRDDKKSLSEIAHGQYPKDWAEGKGKRSNQLAISRIRRSIQKVEKYLDRGKPDFGYSKKERKQIAEVIKKVLGH